MSHVKEKTRLAIIGDGLAAAICLEELSKKEFNTDIQIDVFAPEGSVGRAYASDVSPHMLLNHMVKSMRFNDMDGHGFLGYLKSHFNENATLEDYVPRSVFGDYVAYSTQRILEECEHINVIEAKADSIKVSGDDFQVDTQEQSFSYDEVIMCVGNGGREGALAASIRLDHVNMTDAHIAVIGASLSGIDMVNEIFSPENQEHVPQKVTFLQRTAGFRMVRPHREVSYEAKIFTSDHVRQTENFTCEDLIALIEEEMQIQGVEYDLETYGGLRNSPDFARDMGATLKRLSEHQNDPEDHVEFKIYGIMKAIIPALMDVFECEKITLEEAMFFRKRMEKQIFAFLAPMPAEVAEKLALLIEEGRLDIESGYDADRDDLLRDRYDHYIDVRGINHIIRTEGALPSLFNSLVRDSGSYVSSLGGVAYDPETLRLRSSFSDAKMPYIVGQTKKGQQFDCSESFVIYSDCQRVIADLECNFVS